MEISAQQTSLFTEDTLMSLQEDSRAKMHRLQSKMVKVNKGYEVKGQDSFLKWSEQSEKSDQRLLLPKMSQIFLKLTEGQTLQQFFPNYPQWGTMQNGEFAERQKSVRPITAPGCIWLLTPVASDCLRYNLSFAFYKKRHHRSPGSLTEQIYRLTGGAFGRVNHQFYAWMMGYPINWLHNTCTDTETQ